VKAVMLDSLPLNPGDLSFSPLEALCELTVYPRTPDDLFDERVQGAEVLFTNKVVLDKSRIDKLPSLKYVGVLATGYDVVDIAYAKEKGIVVTNVPSYGTQSTAQHVFSLLLSLTNQVGRHDRSVKAGEWVSSETFSYFLTELNELSGMTLGLVGFGRIASQVATIAQSFGMQVICYTPRKKEADNVRFVSLDELFSTSDVISLHCPLTKETEQLVNAERLLQCKKSAILINTGRGALIDEQALAECLTRGGIRHALLDVLTKEPQRADCPLRTLDNVTITPHIAWGTGSARKRCRCRGINLTQLAVVALHPPETDRNCSL